MRFQRCLCLLLIFTFICCFCFCVPTYAAEVELYSFNGVLLPNIDSIWIDKLSYPYAYVHFDSSDNCYVLSLVSAPAFTFTDSRSAVPEGTSYLLYSFSEGGVSWTKSSGGRWTVQYGVFYHSSLVWCSYDVLSYDNSLFMAASDPVLPICDGSSCPSTDANKDNVCDDCGFKFAVLRDYSPFTVKKFMNHIGQILTSAVSWVGNVGSTILEQPLLLAFTALPLCGLGIAVFRRLKETV